AFRDFYQEPGLATEKNLEIEVEDFPQNLGESLEPFPQSAVTCPTQPRPKVDKDVIAFLHIHHT
ncbi:hypothetical protein ACFQ4L_06300, partial [Lapidilactobacillus mulanensis]